MNRAIKRRQPFPAAQILPPRLAAAIAPILIATVLLSQAARAQSPPAVVYVDASYPTNAGSPVTFPNTNGTGTYYIGSNAFNTVQGGVNGVAAGGTVNVAAGTYTEDVTITNPVTLLGPNATNNPNTGRRVAEAVIQPATNGPNAYYANEVTVVTIATNDVTIEGLTVDGYNPDLSGAISSGTNYFNAVAGIADFTGGNSITVENNIVENDSVVGVDLEAGASNAPNTNNCITGNLIQNIDYVAAGFGWGVLLYRSSYAEITNNYILNVAVGILAEFPTYMVPADTAGRSFSSNYISASMNGIALNNAPYAYVSGAPPVNYIISGNTLVFAPTNSSGFYGPAEWDGVLIGSIYPPVSVLVTNNTVIGPAGPVGYNTVGYNIWETYTYYTSTNGILISGGSISNVSYGVWVNDYDGSQTPAQYPTFATVNHVNISGASLAGVYVQDDPRASAPGLLVQATVTGDTIITNSRIGILVQGTNAAASILDNSASIRGNGIGIGVDTGKALIQNNALTGNTVAGINITNNAIVDAGDCSGGDVTGLGTGSGASGSSAGGNNLSGYSFSNAAPWAIANFNAASTPAELAENDNFGAAPGQNIASDIYDPNGAVEYSQGPAFVTPPTNVTVFCASEVPAGATNLAQFIAQGGTYSANSATVAFSNNTNLTGNGVITRTYTVTDTCGDATNCAQTITVFNPDPPVISGGPGNIIVTNTGGCNQGVTWTPPTASDNCSVTNFTSNYSPGTEFPVGTTTVTYIAAGNNGLTATDSFNVTVIDASTTTLATSTNSITYGNPVTFTATVSSCSEKPSTGTVTFMDGNTNLGTATNSAGQAMFTAPLLAAGLHPIKAVYSGDTYYTPSASLVLTQMVTAAMPVFSGLSSLTNSYGVTNVILTGELSAAGPEYPASNDIVTATIHGVPVAGTVTNGSGGFRINYNNPSLATNGVLGSPYTITYNYGGDTNVSEASASDSSTSLTITNATPVITWSKPANITYPTALSGTQLDATVANHYLEAVSGAFTYTPTNGTVLSAGSNQTLSVTFAPTDTNDYTSASANASINVSAAMPLFTGLVSLTNSYGVTNLILTGELSATGPAYPRNGDAVTATIHGVPVAGTVTNGTGGFRINYNNPSLATNGVLGSPYTIIYSYGGDTNVSLAGATNNSTSLTITQATPVITWGNPANITYPTALSGAQLDATVANYYLETVSGTFAYTPTNGTVLSAGSNQTLSATFAPSDTNDYTSASKAVSINVSAASPTFTGLSSLTNSYGVTNLILTGELSATGPAYPDNGDAVTATIHGVPVAGTVTNGTGGFRINYNDPSLATNGVLGSPYTITYNYGGDTNVSLAGATNNSTSLTITQATPVITWANPSAITYPTALSGAQLDATVANYYLEAVSGTFAYTPTNGTVLSAGNNQTLSVTFAPTDTNDYTSASANVSINVNAALPTFSGSSSLTNSYGVTNLILTGELSATGPAYPNNGDTATATINGISVPGSVTNGTGGFLINYNDPSLATNGVLGSPYTIIYSYGGDTNVSLAGATNNSTSLTITQATPVITWGNPVNLTYPMALSGAQLNATVANHYLEAVSGTFTYTPTNGTVLSAGNNQTLSVAFAPTDTNDYTSASANVSINVEAAMPLFSGLSSLTNSYGVTNLILTGELSATGPAYPQNGDAVTATIHGVPVAGTVTNGTGGFLINYNDPSLATNGVLGSPYTITYNYGGDTNVSEASASDSSTSLTITQATPVITWANPSAITYPMALSGAQLNATVANHYLEAVSGTFTYTPTNGTVLSAGNNQTLSVAFAPTDTNDYTSASANVSINVNAALPTFSGSSSLTNSYGVTNLILTGELSATGPAYPNNGDTVTATIHGVPVAGTVTNGTGGFRINYNDPSLATNGVLGSPYTIIYSYGGDTNVSLAGATNNSTSLTITQATPVITWGNPANITYPTALSGAQLDATVANYYLEAVSGTFTYTPTNGTVLSAGNNQTLSVAFAPTDTNDYISASANVSINVSAASPVFSGLSSPTNSYGVTNLILTGELSATGPAYPQNGDAVTATIHGVPVAGTVTNGTGGFLINYNDPSLATNGVLGSPYTITYNYGGDTNVSEASASDSSTSLTITQATPVITWANPSAITYPTALSGTQLDATVANHYLEAVSGTFTYTPTNGTVLSAGSNQSLSVTFAPTDTNDYTSASANASINVSAAMPLFTGLVSLTNSYGVTNLILTGELSATGPAYPQNGDAVTATIHGVPVAGTVTNGTGGFRINYNDPSLATNGVLGSPYTIIYSYGGDTNVSLAGATNNSTSLTITQATPVITWGNPANITYPTALSGTQLDATVANYYLETVSGAFTYTPTNGTVLSAGNNQTLSVTFAPTDTNDYTSAGKAVSINVNAASPVFSGLSSLTNSYGVTNLILTGELSATGPAYPDNGDAVTATIHGVPVAGTVTNGTGGFRINYNDPSLATNGVLGSPYTITYNYGGDTNVSEASASDSSTSLTITQATPVITWANPSAITYPTALSGAQLDATVANHYLEAVSGAFTYTPANGTVLSAGNNRTLSVAFAPTDTNDYTSASKTVNINVEAASPLFSGLHSLTNSYGVTNLILTGELSATGPAYPQNGDAVTATIHGVPVAGTVTNGTGGFRINYNDPSLATNGVLGSPYTITYNYGGDTNVSEASASDSSTSLTITQATPVITWSNPANITYPTALSGAQLDATVANYYLEAVSGTFTYSPANGTVLSAGSNQTLSVTFAPTDTNDYTSAGANVSINVEAAPPAITSQPTNVNAVVGQNVNLTVTATGTPLNYQWYFNNAAIPSATSNTLTLLNVTTNNAGAYFVTVTNVAGAVTSSNVTLSVYATAAANLSGISYKNGSFVFTVTGVPGYPYSVQWSTNLIIWVPIITNTSPFIFTNTSGYPSEFYRASYQQ